MQKTLRSPHSSMGSGEIGKKLPLDERLMLRLKESQDAGNKLQGKSRICKEAFQGRD